MDDITSHYSRIKSSIKRKDSLVKALKKINNGKWANAVEVHKEATNLYGYQNDKRADKAEIIIRRADVGQSSNDIGFKLTADGTYEAIISDYDSGYYNQQWRDKLSQVYAETVIEEVAAEYGYSFHSEKIDNEIFINCEVN